MVMQLFKYGLVTAVSYVILLAGSYFLVEKLQYEPGVSYFIMISLVYIGVYVAYTKFVFAVSFSRKRMVRFGLVLAAIWIANNLFFNIMNIALNIPYLAAILLNIVIFGAVRFFIQRNFVFKNETQ